MTSEKILGSETDDALLNRVIEALKKLGYSASSSEWSVAGSQEIETLELVRGDDTIRLERETYVGLSACGNRALIEEMERAL